MNKENIRKVIDFTEKIPADRFDMSVGGTSIDEEFGGCVIGHMIQAGLIPELSLDYSFTPDRSAAGIPGVGNWLEGYFDVDRSTQMYGFLRETFNLEGPMEYRGWVSFYEKEIKDITPTDVANKLRELL